MRKKIILVITVVALCALAGCGKKTDGHLKAGMECVINQDYNGALNYFDQAVSDGEDLKQIYRGMALAYMGQEDYAKAITTFDKALAYGNVKPTDIDFDIDYYLAVCYFKINDYDKAIGIYDAIIDMHPKDSGALYTRGSMKIYAGNLEGAIEDFDKAVSISKKNYSLYLDIYEIMSKLGYVDEGQKYIDTVDNLGKNATVSDYDKGRLVYFQQKYANAISYLERAKKTDDSNKEIIYLLSDCYKKTDQYDKASVAYSTFLNLYPDAEMNNQLGICYVQMGDYDKALNAFQSGIAVTENNTCMQSLLLNEIACYEYKHEYATAKAKLEQYLAVYPSTPELEKEYAFLSTR